MNDMPPEVWFAADVTVDHEAVSAAEAALDALDPMGIEVDSLRRSLDEPIRVTAYFAESPDIDRLRNVVLDHLVLYDHDQVLLSGIEVRTVENSDWLAEWKKHWQPTVVGKFMIAPPWSDVQDDGQILIRIEPNMAFGTGTHETTQLCLKAIGDVLRPEDSFLDIGTGTGILAIAAAKLGASPILACDTDTASVAIARENAEANGAGRSIVFADGSISGEMPKFDLVCANLTIDVIIPILDDLLSKANAKLLLSGILSEQEGQIIDALAERECFDRDVERQGEWIAVLVNVN